MKIFNTKHKILHIKYILILAVILGLSFFYISSQRNTRIGSLTRIYKTLSESSFPVEPLETEEGRIEFPFTDDLEGETLEIKADKKEYNEFSGSYVHFSVTNTLNTPQKTALLFYFDKEQKKQPDKKTPSGYITGITKIETRANDKWEGLKFFKENVKINANLLGKALEKRNSIPEYFEVDSGTETEIPAGQTAYFRSKIQYPPGSEGEFWIEALGMDGGYGLLDPWYNSSWSYRKQITVDYKKVSGTSNLSNFPMLISATDADFKHTDFGGKVASSSAGVTGGGGDFVITSSDGTTKLDHEIEKYASSSGNLIAWVEVPTLSVTQDTILYVYYGGPSSGATNQNPTGVWDSNYKGVWHLSQGDSTASAFYTDSTSNANNGTLTDADGDSVAATGQVDGAFDFNGDADVISAGSGASIDNFSTYTI